MIGLKEKNLFSIIIPNFDDVRIENTIQSIIDQDFKDYELIIVEGCLLNKNSSVIYEKYKKNIDLLIHEQDKGIFDALNKGILMSKGEYIFLIGSDDKLSHNDIFKKVYAKIKSNVDGVCINCLFVNSDNKVIRKWVPGKVTANKIKYGIIPPHFSLFLNKKLYEKIGLFDITKEVFGLDSIWLLNLCKIADLNILTVKNRATVMEIGGTSTVSINNIFKGNINFMYAAKQQGLFSWPFIVFVKILSKVPQFIFNK